MRIMIGLVGLGIGTLLAVGCGRAETKGPDAPSTTSARVASNEDAIARITTTRCDREAACNNVGAGRSFETAAACTSQYGHDKRADLRAEECPRGISAPDLADCLAEIRSEKCGNPLDSASRIAACRKGKLCLEK
jgi:hypothetical protein